MFGTFTRFPIKPVGACLYRKSIQYLILCTDFFLSFFESNTISDDPACFEGKIDEDEPFKLLLPWQLIQFMEIERGLSNLRTQWREKSVGPDTGRGKERSDA